MKKRKILLTTKNGSAVPSGEYWIENVVISPKCRCITEYSLVSASGSFNCNVKVEDIKTLKFLFK
jgi:hypothetical protein